MKILLYINVLSSGGAERVMSNLANEFSKKNEVILVNSYKTENEYKLSSNIKHIYLDDNVQTNFLRKNISRINKLRTIIKKERPDIAISFMAEPNFRLLLANMFLPFKTIISIRNDPTKEYPNILFKTLAKILFLKADGIVFQTNDAKSFFSKKIQKKSKIIYNPIKSDFYKNKSLNIGTDIVAVGRLTSQKNHNLLIDSFYKISSEIKDNLYIYGDGELKTELQNKINKLNLSNRVFLMGNVQDLHHILPKYKLYILPSDYEGMPNSLMEGMACGLPCISTDCPCGGPKELLSMDYLFKVNDSKELSNKILKMLNSEELLKKAKQENIKKSYEFLDKNILNEWYDFIKLLIA